MITETYKGRKIKATRGREWGYTRLIINGVDLGDTIDADQAHALAGLKRTIDAADEAGVASGRYGAEYYAKGTYEICDNGHAKPISGPCGHQYCAKQAHP